MHRVATSLSLKKKWSPVNYKPERSSAANTNMNVTDRMRSAEWLVGRLLKNLLCDAEASEAPENWVGHCKLAVFPYDSTNWVAGGKEIKKQECRELKRGMVAMPRLSSLNWFTLNGASCIYKWFALILLAATIGQGACSRRVAHCWKPFA